MNNSFEESRTSEEQAPSSDAPFGEQEAFFNEHPERLIESGRLNNFLTGFPGAASRKQFGEYNLLDESMQSQAENSVGGEDITKRKIGRGSELRQKQTLREFYAAIDSAIQEAGLDVGKIEKEIEEIENLSGEERSRRKEELEKRVLKAGVYCVLRKRGYTHYDLWQ